MDVMERRALLPSFLFLGALGFALASSSIAGHIYLWSGLACLVLLYISGYLQGFKLTALSLAVFAFIGMVLLSILLLAHNFPEDGFYYILYLLFSFIAFSCIPRELLHVPFCVIIACLVLLAGWGLIQYFTGLAYIHPNWPRANAIFITPNTFAAALNLVMLPMAAAYIYGLKRPWFFAISLLLFAALLVTQSRGGYLSFAIGLITLVLMTIYKKPEQGKARLIKLIGAMALVFLLFSGYENFKIGKSAENSQALSPGVVTLERLNRIDSDGRLLFYDIAIKHIKTHPLLGYGYTNFKYYYHRDRPVWDYKRSSFGGFVHDDYIQIWAETGLPGIIALLLIIYLFYRAIFQKLKGSEDPGEIMTVTGLAAGLTAYFSHALVDFVLYPPALLFLFGAYLGVANRLLANKISAVDKFSLQRQIPGIRPAVIRAVTGSGLLLILVQPVVAQQARAHGDYLTSIKDLARAQAYYSYARSFAPYNPEYYFLEGRLWMNAAIASDNKKAGNYADNLFKQGAGKTPFDLENTLIRALLHRDHPKLLTEPADLSTIAGWFDRMLLWHPDQEQVYFEYIKTLLMAGRQVEGKRLLNKALIYFPLSGRLHELKQTVNHATS